MFKKIGTPVLIEEVASFDTSKAEVVKCSCGKEIGLRSAGLFKATGSLNVSTPGSTFTCSCGETNHV